MHRCKRMNSPLDLDLDLDLDLGPGIGPGIGIGIGIGIAFDTEPTPTATCTVCRALGHTLVYCADAGAQAIRKSGGAARRCRCCSTSQTDVGIDAFPGAFGL